MKEDVLFCPKCGTKIPDGCANCSNPDCPTNRQQLND